MGGWVFTALKSILQAQNNDQNRINSSPRHKLIQFVAVLIRSNSLHSVTCVGDWATVGVVLRESPLANSSTQHNTTISTFSNDFVGEYDVNPP